MSDQEPTTSIRIRTCDRDALKRMFNNNSIKEVIKFLALSVARDDEAGRLATKAILKRMYHENVNELIENHERYEYFNELTDAEFVEHYQYVKERDLPMVHVTRYYKLRQ